VFPIELVVTKISGGTSSQDNVFLGVLRQPPVNDPTMLKLWTTTAGTILCAEARFSEWFGLQPHDLVGRAFSSLSTDIEGLNR
jgi:hypothetical protein